MLETEFSHDLDFTLLGLMVKVSFLYGPGDLQLKWQVQWQLTDALRKVLQPYLL